MSTAPDSWWAGRVLVRRAWMPRRPGRGSPYGTGAKLPKGVPVHVPYWIGDWASGGSRHLMAQRWADLTLRLQTGGGVPAG